MSKDVRIVFVGIYNNSKYRKFVESSELFSLAFLRKSIKIILSLYIFIDIFCLHVC